MGTSASEFEAASPTTHDRISSRAEVQPAAESRGHAAIRHGKRARFYTWVFLLVALLVVLVGLIAANARAVKLDWVVGSTHASLIWIILAAAVIGWLLGIATSVVSSHRTRRRV
jgi:uncharacterized integral membrane protein